MEVQLPFVLGYFNFGDTIDHNNPFGILGVSVNEIQVVKPFITVKHDSTAFQLIKLLIQLA